MKSPLLSDYGEAGEGGLRQPSCWGLYKPEVDRASVVQPTFEPKFKGIMKGKEKTDWQIRRVRAWAEM